MTLHLLYTYILFILTFLYLFVFQLLYKNIFLTLSLYIYIYIELNMFLVPQVLVNFGIISTSKLYTNLVIYL